MIDGELSRSARRGLTSSGRRVIVGCDDLRSHDRDPKAPFLQQDRGLGDRVAGGDSEAPEPARPRYHRRSSWIALGGKNTRLYFRIDQRLYKFEIHAPDTLKDPDKKFRLTGGRPTI